MGSYTRCSSMTLAGKDAHIRVTGWDGRRKEALAVRVGK